MSDFNTPLPPNQLEKCKLKLAELQQHPNFKATAEEQLVPFKLQELFDLALWGIRAQNYEQSVRVGFGGQCTDVCSYRGAGNTKCAIGHCIPDQFYEDEFDHNAFEIGVLSLLDRKNVFRSLFWEQRSKVSLLQSIHDSMLYYSFELEMLKFAKQNELIYSPLPEDQA